MEKSVFRSDDASILQMLTEGKELEKWQNFICDVANVFICCVDSRGTPLTPFGGNPDEVGRVLKATGNNYRIRCIGYLTAHWRIRQLKTAVILTFVWRSLPPDEMGERFSAGWYAVCSRIFLTWRIIRILRCLALRAR